MSKLIRIEDPVHTEIAAVIFNSVTYNATKRNDLSYRHDRQSECLLELILITIVVMCFLPHSSSFII